MLITAPLTIADLNGNNKCPSAEEWVNKIWYLYTMKYYLVIKQNEIMPFAATQMQLEILILSELSQKKTNNI